MTTEATHPYFSSTYAQARRHFLAASQAAGATIVSELYPNCDGPSGEALAQDLALFGNLQADTWLVALSGTHGPEGFAGSAIQLDWIRRFGASVPHNMGVALLHGVNPWGFAYGQRTTRNNVDLNRNFVDHSHKSDAIDPIFREISAAMEMETPSEEAFGRFHESRDALIAEHGLSVFGDAMVRGQYHDSAAVCFGGHEREWSNLALEKLLRENIGSPRKMCLVDWHTGLGEHGKPFFLSFTESQALFNRAVEWWGESVVRDAGGIDGTELPNYSGTVCQGVRSMFDSAESIAFVIEIGTYPFNDMSDALLVENWLRAPVGVKASDRDAWVSWVVEKFCPASVEWRESAVTHGGEIMAKALAGVSDW